MLSLTPKESVKILKSNRLGLTLIIDKNIDQENLSNSGGSFYIEIISLWAQWTASSTEPWLELSPQIGNGNGYIKATYKANNKAQKRRAKIILKIGESKEIIEIKQSFAKISTTKEDFNINNLMTIYDKQNRIYRLVKIPPLMNINGNWLVNICICYETISFDIALLNNGYTSDVVFKNEKNSITYKGQWSCKNNNFILILKNTYETLELSSSYVISRHKLEGTGTNTAGSESFSFTFNMHRKDDI